MTVGDGKTVPDPEYAVTKRKLLYFRYREKFRLSYREMLLEPMEEIQFAIAVWEQEAERDKLELRRQEAKAEEQRNKST